MAMTDEARRLRLTTALGGLSRDPRVATTPIRDLVTAALPDSWHVVGHRVQFFAEVLVLREGGSDTWGVLVLPIPVKGCPSTWKDVPPEPVPYDTLSPGHRARLLAHERDVRIGTLPEIIASYLDPVDEVRDDEDLLEEERKVPTGYLVVLAVLLDVAPQGERPTLESRLRRSGVETPVTVRLTGMPPTGED
jgi:hypothetical protein